MSEKLKKELAVARTIGDKELIKKSRAKLRTRTDKLSDFVEEHPNMRRDYARTRVSEEYKPKASQKDLPAGPLENHNRVNNPRGEKGENQIIEETTIKSKLDKPSRVYYQEGAKLNDDEKTVLEWIKYHIPGRITVLKTSKEPGIKTPDLSINGLSFDIKTTSGNINTLDSHLRHAAKQTLGGGVIVNISEARYSIEDAKRAILRRMQRSGLSEVMVLNNNELILHLKRVMK